MNNLAKILSITMTMICGFTINAKAEKIDWWAVTTSQVENARCQFENNRSADYRRKYLAEIEANRHFERTDSSVFDINFRDESPQFIYKFMQLTRKVDLFGVPESKIQVKLIAKYPDLIKCSKVQCALGVMFGAEVAERMLFLIVKYDFNTSPLAFDNSSAMTTQELDSILYALDLVPPYLIKLGLNKKLVHFLKGYRPADQSDTTVANATINLFGSWSDLSFFERSQTLYHEISHNWSETIYYGQLDHTKNWLELSGWKESSSEMWTHSLSNVFVSKYAAENPAEDFAETSLAYRFAPEKLKVIAPTKYNYMKKMIYGENEFLTDSKCQRESITQLRIVQQTKEILQSEKMKEELPQIINQCRGSYAESIKEPLAVKKFEDCIVGYAFGQAQTQVLGQFATILPRYLFDPYFKQANFADIKAPSHLAQNFQQDLKKFCNKNFTEISDFIKKEDVIFRPSSKEVNFANLAIYYAQPMVCQK